MSPFNFPSTTACSNLVYSFTLAPNRCTKTKRMDKNSETSVGNFTTGEKAWCEIMYFFYGSVHNIKAVKVR